jgi:hypothetical protein
MPVAAQPLGCDVTQQEGEVRSVSGCYATFYKQSLFALGSDVLNFKKIHQFSHFLNQLKYNYIFFPYSAATIAEVSSDVSLP